jgi:hypothetical protein
MKNRDPLVKSPNLESPKLSESAESSGGIETIMRIVQLARRHLPVQRIVICALAAFLFSTTLMLSSICTLAQAPIFTRPEIEIHTRYM